MRAGGGSQSTSTGNGWTGAHLDGGVTGGTTLTVTALATAKPTSESTALGGGVAGTNAAKMAVGLEANVTILEKNLDRIRQLEDLFGARGQRS